MLEPKGVVVYYPVRGKFYEQEGALKSAQFRCHGFNDLLLRKHRIPGHAVHSKQVTISCPRLRGRGKSFFVVEETHYWWVVINRRKPGAPEKQSAFPTGPTPDG